MSRELQFSIETTPRVIPYVPRSMKGNETTGKYRGMEGNDWRWIFTLPIQRKFCFNSKANKHQKQITDTLFAFLVALGNVASAVVFNIFLVRTFEDSWPRRFWMVLRRELRTQELDGNLSDGKGPIPNKYYSLDNEKNSTREESNIQCRLLCS